MCEKSLCLQVKKSPSLRLPSPLSSPLAFRLVTQAKTFMEARVAGRESLFRDGEKDDRMAACLLCNPCVVLDARCILPDRHVRAELSIFYALACVTVGAGSTTRSLLTRPLASIAAAIREWLLFTTETSQTQTQTPDQDSEWRR